MPAKKNETEPIGKIIKKARLKKKISHAELGNETGISTDMLKSVEKGDTPPPVGMLLQISKALQIDSGELLKKGGPTSMESRVVGPAKTDSYYYSLLTTATEGKHLQAYKIDIDPSEEYKKVEYQHDGEEFVYVLEGNIEVIVGENVNKLVKADFLHFNSGIKHSLKNIGEEKAELVVVLYNP